MPPQDSCRVLPFRNSLLFFDDSPDPAIQPVEHQHAETQVTWHLPTTRGDRQDTAARRTTRGVRETLVVPAWTPHCRTRTSSCASLVLHLSPALMHSTADELLGTSDVELIGGATRDPVLAQLGASAADEIGYAWGESLFLDALTHVIAGHLVRKHARTASRAQPAWPDDGLSASPAWTHAGLTARQAWPLAAADSTQAAADGGLSARQLDRLREFVETRLDHPPALREMAAALEIDVHRFIRLLKRSTHLGPHGYLTQRRINRAQQLLRYSRLSLVQIALTLGFSSQSHFTAVFHRWVGVTPGAYRRQHVGQ